MKTSSEGIAVMMYFENCRLTAYPDPATGGDPWTIGVGDTGPDVVEGLTITKSEALARFANRLAREFEPGVERALRIPATQCQADAMICLAFNIGLGNFARSTLVAMFNDGDMIMASREFLNWNRAGGKVMLGLRRRRAAEQALFDGASGVDAIAIGAAVT